MFYVVSLEFEFKGVIYKIVFFMFECFMFFLKDLFFFY